MTTKATKTNKKSLKTRILQNKQVYIMMLPVLVLLLVFSYYPMYGIVLAFKDYLPNKGIWGSEWVGLKHFQAIFALPDFFRAFRNTIIISLITLLFCFPAPVILALLLNEVTNKPYKKFIQTCIYFPNFISWVILAGILGSLLNYSTGTINNVLAAMGLPRVEFLANEKLFYPVLIISCIIKDAGWGTIIYTAGITNIDPTLYEAAAIDGCKRWGMARHITLPSIAPIILIMFTMQVGNILNANFDAIYNLYNPTVYSVADVIDTLVMRTGFEEGHYERGTAIGLFKSVINFILLLSANAVVKKINGYGMYEVAE